MKILTFNKFIEEGLWSKTFNRAKSGDERMEDKISIEMAADCFDINLNKHDIYRIDGYKEYFIVIYKDYSIDKKTCIETYHYPNEYPICTYDASNNKIPQISLSPDTDFFGIHDMPKEDQKLFDSDEFISAINNTIKKIYK